MPADLKKKRPRKDALDGAVAEIVGVLDESRPPEEGGPESTIESAVVREALKRNRSYGDLPLKYIEPDPDQPRRVDTNSESFSELVASVKQHGVIEPITVRFVPEKNAFRIITGERRYRAAKKAGLDAIPAIVRDVSDTDKAVHQIVENLQRENMNPVDEAKAFRRYLAATGGSQDQLAKRIGKSKAYVSQVMSILEKLTVEEQEEVARVSPAKLPGKSLILEALRLDDVETRSRILRGELTRHEAREEVRKRTTKRPGRPKRHTTRVRLESGATVTVTLPSSEATQEEVLRALEDAVESLRNELAR